MSERDPTPEPDTEPLRERLQRVEERLAALEARFTPAAGQPAAAADPGADDRFWALAGLRERVGNGGAVLFTGSVRLPDGERAEWQQGVTTESLLAADWEPVCDAVAALAHPVRLNLLRTVLTGGRTITELSQLAGIGTSGQLYHHLRQLVAAGWLRPVGRGRYELTATRVVPLLTIIAAAQR